MYNIHNSKKMFVILDEKKPDPSLKRKGDIERIQQLYN